MPWYEVDVSVDIGAIGIAVQVEAASREEAREMAVKQVEEGEHTEALADTLADNLACYGIDWTQTSILRPGDIKEPTPPMPAREALLRFAEHIAYMTRSEEFLMLADPDDAIETMDALIAEARELTGIGGPDTEGGEEPSMDDTVLCCPDCDTPNQFGELCPSCERERQIEYDRREEEE